MKTVSFRADDELLAFLERESESRHLPISTTAQVLLVEYAKELGELGEPDSGKESEKENTFSEKETGDGSSDLVAEIEGIDSVPDHLTATAKEILRKHSGKIEVRKDDEGEVEWGVPLPEPLNNQENIRWMRTLDGTAKNLYRWWEADERVDVEEAKDHVGARY